MVNNNFQYETDNLRLSKKNFKVLELNIRNAIKEDDDDSLNAFLPFLCINAEMIIENNLYQIIADEKNKKFGSTVREHGLSLTQKWTQLIDKSIEENYGVKKDDLKEDIKSKYDYLITFLEETLRWLATNRNKIAHGQLKEAFNKTRINHNAEISKDIQSLNYFQIKKTKEIFVKVFAKLVRYSAESPMAFENQFDKSFKKFESIKKQFSDEEYYNNYIKTLKSRKPKHN